MFQCFGICLTCTECWPTVKLDLLYCFLSGLDVMVHDFDYVFSNLYSFMLKNIFIALLGVSISDTIHWFVFLSLCLMLLPLSSSLVVSNSFYFCLLPIHNFYCAASYGKPAAETCSLCLSPVAIPFIGFPASLLSTQLTIIWVI